MAKTNAVIVYPFVEDAFTDAHLAAVEILKRVPNRVVVIDKKGRISRMLDEAGIRYAVVASSCVVTPHNFILTAVIRLLRISLAQFLFVRQLDVSVTAVHFFDMTSALTWSGTCRMFRLPFVISVNAMERFSKYATMVLAEARFLTAATPFVKETTPARFQNKMYVVPPLCGVIRLTGKAAARERSKQIVRAGGKEDDWLIATATAANASEVKSFSEELSRLSGKKTVIVSCVRARDDVSDKAFLPFDAWKDMVSCCDAFVGFDDCTPDATAFFAAVCAEIPVFGIGRGSYAALIDDGENGRLLAVDDVAAQAQAVYDVLTSDVAKRAMKQSQRAWYDVVRKKTVDFTDEMYDSV